MRLVLALDVDDETSATVARAAAARDATVARASSAQALQRLTANADDVALVLVGPGVDEPVRTAQRVFVLAPGTPVLLLAVKERLESLRGAVQIAPYVTQFLRCLAAEDLPVVGRAVHEALERLQQARAYSRTVAALNARLGEAPPVTPPALLGGILDNAPIGVVLIDATATVRAWNPASAKLLGRVEREALGVPFDQLLADAASPAWRELLASVARDGRESATALFERDVDGRVQHLEIIAAPLRSMPGTHLLLLQDVSERVRLVSELEDAVRARDEFLGIAAHELRTPLTTLELHVRSLGRGGRALEPERLPERLQSIDRSVKRLARLVESLLDVTRIQEGRLELQTEDTDLVPIAQEVLDRLRPDAERAGSVIALEADAAVTGHWDPFRLDQVLTNLLSNAIKYGDHKPVTVGLTATPDEARLTVRDDGIGMDAAFRARLFGRFERGVSSRNYGGLGLGLWITRTIVEAHGGRIEVESRHGAGSEFVVTLPRSA